MAIYWHASSGHAFPIDGGTIPPSLKWQDAILLPTTRSDHVAVTHNDMEASHLRSPISEAFADPEAPTPLFPDNHRAAAPTHNHQYHPPDHTHRHVAPLNPLGHEEVELPSSCPTDGTAADACTKPLPSTMGKHFAVSLGLHVK